MYGKTVTYGKTVGGAVPAADWTYACPACGRRNEVYARCVCGHGAAPVDTPFREIPVVHASSEQTPPDPFLEVLRREEVSVGSPKVGRFEVTICAGSGCSVDEACVRALNACLVGVHVGMGRLVFEMERPPKVLFDLRRTLADGAARRDGLRKVVVAVYDDGGTFLEQYEAVEVRFSGFDVDAHLDRRLVHRWAFEASWVDVGFEEDEGHGA